MSMHQPVSDGERSPADDTSSLVSPHRRVRATLLTALTTLALALVVGDYLHRKSFEESLQNGSIINTAGRQRMLCQRIAQLATRSIDGPRESWAMKLESATNRFTTEYDELASFVNGRARTWSTRESMDEALVVTEPLRHSIVTDARRLHAGPLTPIEHRDAVQGIVRDSEHLLPRLETAVERLEQAVEGQISQGVAAQTRFHWTLFLLTLSFGVVVTERVVRLIRRQHELSSRRRSEIERLAAVTRFTTNAVVMTDVQGSITWVNEGFTRLSGLSEREAIGRPAIDVFRSEGTSSEALGEILEACRNERAYRGEIHYRGEGGKELWLDLDIHPSYGDDGELAGFVVIQNDITSLVQARQRAEQSLNEARDNQAALAQARALLEQTGRIARVGGWTMDLDKMEPVWSDEVYRIHEVEIGQQPPLEEAIDFYAPEARDTIRAAVEQGIADGTPWDLELPFITAKDNRRWVRAIGIPEMENGKCVRLWGAFQDITSRYESQRSVEALARRLETATEGAGVGVWEYHVDRNELIWDRAMHEIYGTDPDDGRGNYELWSSALHPEDMADAEVKVEESSRTGKRFETKFRIRRPNGQTRYIEASAIVETDEQTGETRMVGINRDITDQRTTEERLSLAMKAARIGLWDWEVPTGEACFSDTFYTMLGYEPLELPMSLDTWKELCHPEDLDSAVEDIQRHFRGEIPAYENVHRLRRKDGTWLWIRDVGEVVEWDDDGAPKRMIGVHVDIQDLKEMAAKAEQASRSKSEFLANMSHEMRTPMTAILGFTELLAETTDAVEGREAIATVRRNGDHLLSVINDILDLSKIEAGKMTIEAIEVDPLALLAEVSSLVQFRAHGKGLKLELCCDGPIPERIQSDPTRLRQILINLIGNAIKFTEVGTITLRARFLDVDAGPMMEFDVADTGIGMTDDQATKLFQPFSQADNSTTRRFGGTGLGLTISKRLAQMLGGDITLRDTEIGRGTTFTASVHTGSMEGVTLIEADPRGGFPVEIPDGPKADAVSLDGAHVLLAEDGPDNQRLISHVLKKAGARVVIRENGERAVEAALDAAAANEPFDVIFMDMQMPVLDGYDATRRLRDQGYEGAIVALTAHAMEGDRQKCVDAGCDDYATKPIDRERLLVTVARFRDATHA